MSHSNSFFTELPYAKRQFIVVEDDGVIEAERQPKHQPSTDNGKKSGWIGDGVSGLPDFGGAIRAVNPFPQEWKDVLKIDMSETKSLVFPPGHPRFSVLYVGHPAVPGVYFSADQFHRFTFEHKFSEAVQMLMDLGATRFEVEHMAGWSREFTARLELKLPLLSPKSGPQARGDQKSESQILFAADLCSSRRPSLPKNLVWFAHEPMWQQVAKGRLEHGLRNFSLTVSYEDDFGVNAGLKLKANKAGLNLGGSFEDHKPTIWRVVGEFAVRGRRFWFQ